MTKIGIIGAGQWSTPYAMAAKNLNAEVCCIYAPDSSAAALADKVGSRAVASAREVIDGCDCVLIGSPTGTHAEYLAALAESGKPALCASPIAANATELRQIEQAVAGKTNLYASLTVRSRPEYQKLKSAIASGDLGTLGMVRLGICLPRATGWRADESKSGGALLETGVYLIDALEWLVGPVRRIYGAAPESDLKYNVLVARAEDGTIAHLEISWAEADGVAYDYYEVSGTNGLLEYDSRTAPLMQVDRRDQPSSEFIHPGASCAQHELQDFLAKALNNKGEFPTAEHGIKVCRKALQVKEAIVAGQVLQLA